MPPLRAERAVEGVCGVHPTAPTVLPFHAFAQVSATVSTAGGHGRKLPSLAGNYPRKEQEMGWFSKDEHHETPCDKTGTWWAKPNPMGWGGNEPRTVKRADTPARKQSNRPAEHGSKAGKALMSGRGALIRWSGDHVQVSGEKPPGRKR